MRLRRWLTGDEPLFPIAVLFALNVARGLDDVAFGILLPEIRHTFHLSLGAIGAMTGVVAPFALGAQLAVAYRGDRRSRVQIAAVGVLLWALFGALVGVAAVLALLVIARAGSAMAKTANVTHDSLIADYYSPDVRSRAYYVYGVADSAAVIIAAGVVWLLSRWWSWRVSFVVFAIPSAALFLVARRLREPVRGAHERRLAGADNELVELEEDPPGFGETFRVLYRLPSVRRVYASLAISTAGLVGIGAYFTLLYSDVFKLGIGARGLVAAATQPVTVAGVAFGAFAYRRWAGTSARRGFRLIGLAGALASLSVAVSALAPTAAVAVGGGLVTAFLAAGVFPGLGVLAAGIIPPQMRTLGFTTGAVYGTLGLVVLPMIGGVGDRYGLRVGILLFIPLLLVASGLLVWAGEAADADIDAIRRSAVVRAEARRRRLRGDGHLLVVRDLEVAIGGVPILRGVDLDVADHGVVAIVGSNGAGKSTLLRAIAGAVHASNGSVFVDGIDVTSADPGRISGLGIACVPGGRSVFPNLTVTENLSLADPTAQDVVRMLDLFPELGDRLDVCAGDLSGGEQQMLSLALGLLARPRLLLVDELSLGLAPPAVERLIEALRTVNAEGTAVIVVEQSVELAARVASRAIFLDRGVVRFDGPTNDLLRRDDLLRPTFLTASAPVVASRPTTRPTEVGGETVLQVTDVAKQFGGVEALRGVTLAVGRGEIVAIVGPNGAGKSTLLDIISGFTQPDRGHLDVLGRDVTTLSPADRAAAGLGRTFQDGVLWPSLTVQDALAVALDRHVAEPNPLHAALGLGSARRSEAAVASDVDDLLHHFGLARYRTSFVGELSTGTRRLVELAGLIGAGAELLLLDEPSSGLAHAEVEALATRLRALRDERACAVLLVEHDQGFVASVADRGVALATGLVVGEGSTEEVLHAAYAER